MEKQTCVKCIIEKELKDFPFKHKKKNKRAKTCLECQRIYAKMHYTKNKAYYLAKGKKSKIKYQIKNKEIIWEHLLANPCLDCGETDPVVLEFDHREKKIGNISVMMHSTTPNILLKEIKKCDVRCANCHRRKTAKDFGYWKYIKNNGSMA
tara:strand:- start:3507 stop:3959 length:453 start_codon:yes stop_codon:yes gene_type:complete